MKLILGLDWKRRAEVTELLLAIAGFQVDLFDNCRHEFSDMVKEDLSHRTHKSTSAQVLLWESGVNSVFRKERFLILDSLFCSNCHIDVLLRSSNDTNVPKSKWDHSIQQCLLGIRTLIHDINLGQHTQSPLPLGVECTSHLKSVTGGHIRVGWDNA